MTILVLAEHVSGALKKSAHELLSAARTLDASAEIHALALGPGAAVAAAELKEWGAHTVHVGEAGFETYAPLRWTRAVADVAKSVAPAALLMGAAALARDIAGRVALRAGGALAGDCT